MHIPPRTGDRCFKETGAGLLKVLMCHCATNAFHATIILVSRYSLDIKEIICTIIRSFINILIGFEHIYCTPLYILKCIRRRVRDPGRKVLIV